MASLYERLQLRGAASLGDAELLSLLMDDGAEGSLERAKALLDAASGSLLEVGSADLARLRMTAGVGLKRAARVAVAAELGRRMATALADREVISIASSEDVVRLMGPQMNELKHEECWAIFLSSSSRVVERMRLSQGGVQGTVVDIRLLLKRALELLTPRLILVHNHPSGAATPSEEDLRLTRRVVEAAALMDIHVVDHLILARGDYYSFRADGKL
uniref:JAB domain-containing protein n=1 Tax=Alistipes sp. TaxID=1872444 RepID=UPI0040571186